MGDEPHVRLVDAHAERNRRDDHDAVLVDEALLIARARLLIEPRVVRKRENTLRRKPFGRFVDFSARETVDDPRFAGMMRAQEIEHLLACIVLLDDRVPDVGAVEAR